MDNQQRRLEYDLSWFAGIYEGEGSFALIKGKRIENGKEIFRYIPSCTLENTDKILINEMERILKENNIGFKIYERTKRRQNCKRSWQIHMIGMKRCIGFISWILPYIRGDKKLRARKILEFCHIRDDQMKGFHGVPYSEKELSLCYEIINIQCSKTLNDYTPNTER